MKVYRNRNFSKHISRIILVSIVKKYKQGRVIEGEGGFFLDCLEKEDLVERTTFMLNSD